MRFTIDPADLEPSPSAVHAGDAHALGKGGFGFVFRSRYRPTKAQVGSWCAR